MPSILFVCVHNACRSQIAEAICRTLAPPSWVIASAGSRPSERVDPKAVAILARHHMVMQSLKPKGLADLPAVRWDYVVSMGCGDACPSVPTKAFIEWGIPDPQDGPMSFYDSLVEDLTTRIQRLIHEIAWPGPPTAASSRRSKTSS